MLYTQNSDLLSPRVIQSIKIKTNLFFCLIEIYSNNHHSATLNTYLHICYMVMLSHGDMLSRTIAPSFNLTTKFNTQITST